MFDAQLLSRLRRSAVLAVLTIRTPTAAVSVARALAAGGIDVIELTLRTPAALDCIRAVTAEVPDVLVGAGTILTPQQVDEALAAGAGFGVSPSTNRDVICHAAAAGLPFAPGVMTPSDVDLAVACGCRTLKFFPAVPAGGLPLLRSIHAPWQHLGLQFIPLGGISLDNLDAWLLEPSVAAIGGSWLVPQSAVDSSNWSLITENASAARAAADRLRRPSSAIA